MQHEERQLELIGTTEFLDQCLERLFRKLRVVRAGINQVTGVPKHNVWLVRKIMITGQVGLRERLGSPLHVVLDENLDCRAPDRSSALQGFRWTAGYRHVRSEQGLLLRSEGTFSKGSAGRKRKVEQNV